jgi:hypothetical protein
MMRFPDYNNPPLRRFSCTFTLSRTFPIERFEQALYRIYDKLQPLPASQQPASIFLKDFDGLEIEIAPKQFTISVYSQDLRTDFLRDVQPQQFEEPPKQFSVIANWQTLKNFIASAILQHPDPANTESIKFECFNEIVSREDFESIGDWIRCLEFRTPQFPAAVLELNGVPSAPIPIVVKHHMAFVWEDHIIITVQIDKQTSARSFELTITSHKMVGYQTDGVDLKWYEKTMQLLDKLRDANFLMFNSLITEDAMEAFQIAEPVEAVTD